jgi:hypothetical protein
MTLGDREGLEEEGGGGVVSDRNALATGNRKSWFQNRGWHDRDSNPTSPALYDTNSPSSKQQLLYQLPIYKKEWFVFKQGSF